MLRLKDVEESGKPFIIVTYQEEAQYVLRIINGNCYGLWSINGNQALWALLPPDLWEKNFAPMNPSVILVRAEFSEDVFLNKAGSKDAYHAILVSVRDALRNR